MKVLFIIALLGMISGAICFVFHAFGKGKKYFTIGTLSSLLSLICLGILTVYQGSKFGFLEQTHNILACFLLALYFYAEFRYRMRLLGALVAPITLILMFVPLISGNPSTISSAALQSNFFLILHVILILLSLALFFISFALAVIYILKTRALKAHKSLAFDGRLPSLSKLQNIFVATFNLGWIVMTAAIVVVGLYLLGNDTDPATAVKNIGGTVIWAIYTILFILYSIKKINTRSLARTVTFFFLIVISFWIFYALNISDPNTTQKMQNIEKGS
ncbi:MAG: cytochrome c biogenesis protein CcsA [Lentisphaeraceae bacterium]|nr:cytochrome c biogenesis protein CcsA [Lentisphaeraceae bacterium]